ncbi:MAG: enoyl-CoA hydratase [Alphaproteobacteria bacterium]|nr:enoyl-CoA hydratase [Alphaproteobacteria bacterium]
MAFENIIAEKKGAVGVLTFNRPHALNAFCAALMDEVTAALDGFENDDAVRVIVVTGGEKAFAAGADIKEMAEKNFPEVYKEDFITRNWESVARCRKPVIAAVAGYCLGGGNELAMMCDFILAADTAKFSQPEITIGTLPGAGGTQRLTRLAGKSKAMELCLTGRMMDAVEAERAGLVARVFPAAELMAETMKIAEKIASFSPLAAMMVKESVNRAYETTLAEGLRFERRLFHASFATEDRKEGMEAFVGKRKASFKGR